MDKKINDNRIMHMHGVAEYMYQNAERYALYPEQMYFMGLNHDIGYMNGANGHEAKSAEILHTLGVTTEMTDLIKCHGMTPQEYKNKFCCFNSEIPDALHLLWEADMHIDLGGGERRI